MSNTFPQENSEAFLNLKKFLNLKNYLEQKITSPACFNRMLWKALRKMTSFYLVFQKRNFLALFHPLNQPLGFITKLLENSSKIVLSKVLPTCRCRDYALRFHGHMHIFYLIQY